MINLELTNYCNFSCEYCPSRWMTRKKGKMSYRLAVKIIRELAGQGTESVMTFHVMGEPLLHPDFEKILRFAKQKGLTTVLVTNGSLLPRAFTARIRPYLDCLIISVTSDSKQVHERRKSGISLEHYRLIVKEAVAGLLGSSTHVLLLYLDQLSSRSGKSGQEKIAGGWREFLVKERRDSPKKSKAPGRSKMLFINQWKKSRRAQTFKLFSNVEAVFLPVSFSWAGLYSGSGKHQAGHCPDFLETLSILWDGKVTICCGDYDGRMALGNVTKSSLKDVLQGNQALIQKMASLNKKNLLYARVCQGCFSPSQGRKGAL
ncbi:MAG: radical SAM protein [Candidatus Omnitrophica bacterium]|nr:radical SAM protein [Candidatus Omnitrophota bacterium]